MKTNRTAITVSNLSKTFSGGLWTSLTGCWKQPEPAKQALKAINLKVYEGEILAILGRNGCGKSTLLRIFSTLLTPDDGDVRVFGHNVRTEYKRIRPLVGRVSADPSFWKMLSAFENLHHSTLLYGLSWKEMKPRIMDMAKEFDLTTAELNRPIRTFSRGMQQKVAIIRALLHDPKLLILDEPTTGLDPVARELVHNFLLSLRERNGMTILLTSHDLEEVAALSDRLCIMKEGEIKYPLHPDGGRLVDRDLKELFFKYTGESINEWEDEPILKAVV